MKRVSNHAEQRLMDQFQRDLDKLELVWPMRLSFARIEPYIVNINQAGIRFRFIIFHRESELWYGDSNLEGVSGDPARFFELNRFNMPRRGDVVFDLGCNAGFWSTWFALTVGETGMVYSFDPCPWNTLSARYQARLNYLDNLKTYNVGIGADRRTIRVPVTAAQTRAVAVPDGDRSGTFEIHSLEEYAHLNPTFIKMDIEGAEMEVAPFLGKIPSLNALYLELHPVMIKERGGDPLDVLRDIHLAGLEIIPDHAWNSPLSEETLHESADAYYCAKPGHLATIRMASGAPKWRYFHQYVYYHLNRGEFDKALEYARRCVELYPGIGHSHLALSDTLMRTGNVADAVAQAGRAVDAAPEDAQVVYHASWVLAVAGDADRSIELARRAVAIDSSVGAFWYHLSAQLAALGRHEEAHTAVAEAIRCEPDNVIFRKYQRDLAAPETGMPK